METRNPLAGAKRIVDVYDLGVQVRRKRKELGMNQQTVAGYSNVGRRFLSDLENGKPTIEMGKALHLLYNLGFDVYIVPR